MSCRTFGISARRRESPNYSAPMPGMPRRRCPHPPVSLPCSHLRLDASFADPPVLPRFRGNPSTVSLQSQIHAVTAATNPCDERHTSVFELALLWTGAYV